MKYFCKDKIVKSCAFTMKSCKFAHTDVIGVGTLMHRGIAPSTLVWVNLQLFIVKSGFPHLLENLEK